MRLASVLWILVTVIGAWLLTGEVLGRDRTLQLVAAGAAGLAPMVQFLSATVTPDAMLFAFWTVALWLGVRVIKRGATARSALALFAVVGAACVVKATSFALLPAAVFAVAIGTWRSRPVYGKRWATIALSAAAGIVGTFGLWFVVAHLVHHAVFAQVSGVAAASGTDVREMLSYVWQFYLPRLPFMTDFPSVAPHIPVYDIWLKGAWANFGWLEVQFSNPVYVTLGLLTIGVTIAAAASLWRYRRTSDTAVGVFLLLVAATLIAGLHWQEYHLVKGGAPNGNQGRYLLPLIGLVGLAVAQALRPLQRRERMIGTAIALGGLFVLNVASLGLTLQRFYA
jgi:4-amino-4-deoxy-L-arabinose transferase-like glycosyltransferase